MNNDLYFRNSDCLNIMKLIKKYNNLDVYKFQIIRNDGLIYLCIDLKSKIFYDEYINISNTIHSYIIKYININIVRSISSYEYLKSTIINVYYNHICVMMYHFFDIDSIHCFITPKSINIFDYYFGDASVFFEKSIRKLL